jgi:hypothetical protein
LEPGVQGRWFEWLVAQEISRRSARRGDPSPEILRFWSGGGHEIDFVVDPTLMIEVERGRTGASEFTWFPRVHPRARLLVVGREPFEAVRIRGLTMEELLLGDW